MQMEEKTTNAMNVVQDFRQQDICNVTSASFTGMFQNIDATFAKRHSQMPWYYRTTPERILEIDHSFAVYAIKRLHNAAR